ncbi:MAG: hypothetical protein WCL56_14035, partial [Sediminibacterium sp.]
WDKSLLNDFVFQWYLKNKTAIQTIKTPSDFLNQYATYDYWTALNQFANASQKPRLKLIEKNKALVQRQILALVARIKWYKQGYYEVENALDPVFATMLP